MAPFHMRLSRDARRPRKNVKDDAENAADGTLATHCNDWDSARPTGWLDRTLPALAPLKKG